MSTRIAINGFGRIGRNFARAVLDDAQFEIAAVNDVADIATMARLLRRDSTYGTLDREVDVVADTLVVGGSKIAVTRCAQPADLPWRELGLTW